jgi:RNA polymerase sigma factor (sigma-70 family)
VETEPNRFEEVFAQHSRDVQAYCLRRASVSDAHDAAAEVFVVVWRRRDAIPDDERVLPWLYGIAARVISNQRRATRRRTAFLKRSARRAEASAWDLEDQVVSDAETAEVLEALDTLSPADREVVLLVAWEELTREEAAAVIGCSVEAAKKRYQRAIRRLERLLAEDRAQTIRSAGLGGEVVGE